MRKHWHRVAAHYDDAALECREHHKSGFAHHQRPTRVATGWPLLSHAPTLKASATFVQISNTYDNLLKRMINCR